MKRRTRRRSIQGITRMRAAAEEESRPVGRESVHGVAGVAGVLLVCICVTDIRHVTRDSANESHSSHKNIGTSHKPGHYHTSPPRRQRVAPQPIHRAEKLKTSAPERDSRQKRGMPGGYGQRRGLLFNGRAEVVLELRLPSCSFRPWEFVVHVFSKVTRFLLIETGDDANRP